MGDNGLPIIGHMMEVFRGGPDFWLHQYRTRGPVTLLDSPIIPTVAALGPDAVQVALLQPQQGLLAARLGSR